MTKQSFDTQAERRATPERGSGLVEPRGLGKQPGIDLIDAMVEAQTAKERLQAVEERRRAALDAIAFDEKIKKRKD